MLHCITLISLADTDITQDQLDLIHRIFSRVTIDEIIIGLKKESDHSEFAANQYVNH
jgi:hypothetical protein